MGPVKLIRGIGRILRGGADRRQVFLGCLLGVVIGMIPGFNGALVLAIALFFFLNANGLLAALGVLLGKVLCLVLAPVTFNIGYVIIHKVGLEGFFRWAADTPVLALMDLDVYSLVGGLPVALVVGTVSILCGTLPAGFGASPWLLLPIGCLALMVWLRVVGRQTDSFYER